MIYVLIPIVLLVWGYIGFQIFNYGEDEDVIEPIRIDQIITNQKQKTEVKTFALNYADPFLKGVQNRPVVNKSILSTKSQSPKKVIPVNWGDVTYNGFVKNQKSEKKIALLNINGRQSLASKGENVQGLIILSIEQDSVLLEKEHSQKWFAKFKK